MEPFSQFAVAAAKQALDQSGIDMEKEDPFRVGVSVGSGIGSSRPWSAARRSFWKKAPAV